MYYITVSEWTNCLLDDFVVKRFVKSESYPCIRLSCVYYVLRALVCGRRVYAEIVGRRKVNDINLRVLNLDAKMTMIIRPLHNARQISGMHNLRRHDGFYSFFIYLEKTS